MGIIKENALVLTIILIGSIFWFSGCTDSSEEDVNIILFTVNPRKIQVGDTTVISWVVKGADKVTIDNWIGRVNLSGSFTFQPNFSTTFTLTATNVNDKETKSAKAVVEVSLEYACAVAMTENGKIKITLITGGDNYKATGYFFADSVTIILNGTVLSESNLAGNVGWEIDESLYIGGVIPTLDDSGSAVGPLGSGTYYLKIIIMGTIIGEDSISVG